MNEHEITRMLLKSAHEDLRRLADKLSRPEVYEKLPNDIKLLMSKYTEH